MQRAGRSASSASVGLVLLHGRGAGARDILGLGEALGLPDLALTAPEAPGMSWWPTSFLAPMDRMEPHVHAGLAQIDIAVDTYLAAGLPHGRIGVLGFSQGACLAAEYLARRGAGLGFAFLLSGGLVGMADAQGGADPALYGYDDKLLNYGNDLSRVQVYMSCHAADPHIPLKRFTDSAMVLRSLGAGVSDRIKLGQGHGNDENDVAQIRGLLNVQTPI